MRESGQLDGSAAFEIVGQPVPSRRKGLIIAKRHIHFSPADAARFGVADNS